MEEIYQKAKARISDQSYLTTASHHLTNLQQRIENKLQEKRLMLGENRPIITTHLTKEQVSNPEPTINQILERKDIMRRQLLDLQLKQSALKKEAILSSASPKKEKSLLTPEDAELLSSLLAKRQKLEKKIKQKDEQLKNQYEQIKIMQSEREKQEVQERRRTNREEAEQKLQKLRERQQQRKLELKETNKALKKLKQQQYLYKKAEQNAAQLQKREYQSKLNELSELAEENKRHIEQIRAHEEEYIRRVRENQQRRQSITLSERSKSEYIRPAANIFSQIVRKQREELEQSRKQRLEQPGKFKTRLESYASQIREKHKVSESPKKLVPTDTTRISLPQIKPLGRTQQFNVGEKYLVQSKKLLSKRGRSLTSSVELAKPVVKAHRKFTDFTEPSRLQFNSKRDQKQLEKVYQLLNDKQIEKIRQAVTVAEKLENSAGRNCERLANSIQAKLLILKTIL